MAACHQSSRLDLDEQEELRLLTQMGWTPSDGESADEAVPDGCEPLDRRCEDHRHEEAGTLLCVSGKRPRRKKKKGRPGGASCLAGDDRVATPPSGAEAVAASPSNGHEAAREEAAVLRREEEAAAEAAGIRAEVPAESLVPMPLGLGNVAEHAGRGATPFMSMADRTAVYPFRVATPVNGIGKEFPLAVGVGAVEPSLASARGGARVSCRVRGADGSGLAAGNDTCGVVTAAVCHDGSGAGCPGGTDGVTVGASLVSGACVAGHAVLSGAAVPFGTSAGAVVGAACGGGTGAGAGVGTSRQAAVTAAAAAAQDALLPRAPTDLCDASVAVSPDELEDADVTMIESPGAVAARFPGNAYAALPRVQAGGVGEDAGRGVYVVNKDFEEENSKFYSGAAVEMSVRVGEMVRVEQFDVEWWYCCKLDRGGRGTSERGWVPECFLSVPSEYATANRMKLRDKIRKSAQLRRGVAH